MPSRLKVYRGLQVPEEELEHKFKEGQSIHLQGFTSTSIEKATALHFALSNVTDKEPVLVKIVIEGDK